MQQRAAAPPEGDGMVAMRLYRLGVDEHEGETGRLVGAIAPGMVGTALDQDVAALSSTSPSSISA